MARDILGGFGPDSSQPQRPRASGGGAQTPRDVMNYAEPSIPGWNPKGSMGPGLGGANLGNCGTQGPKGSSGDGAGGSVGLGGRNKGMGTNRG